MKLSEKQKALIRIGTAYVNGETPNPLDVDIAKRTTKGGRPKGMSYKQFAKMLNMAFSYFHAKSVKHMTPDDAFEDAKKVTGVNVGRKSLDAFCSYMRSGETPTDPKWQHYLEHTRAALEQVEYGFTKLPNHPDYKPRI
jgi:hypothetical protein